MNYKSFIYLVTTICLFYPTNAIHFQCPKDSNCICGGNVSVELHCNIDGNVINMSLLPDTYLYIQCANPQNVIYDKLPIINSNQSYLLKSVIFKECPLPYISFKHFLSKIGVSNTKSLIFQNSKDIISNFDKSQFAGLDDLYKLVLSVNGKVYLPNNLFEYVGNVTWLNLRSDGITFSEELFKPLKRLDTLEIIDNYMSNISANIFPQLSSLRKLSLVQNNVTKFSKDYFSGATRLEELDFSSNSLEQLPSVAFSALSKLKKLTLFSNKLSALPTNLFKNNKNLETITVLNNDVKLKALPRGIFSDLPNLKYLHIQRCELELVPSDVLTNSFLITNISFAYNEITDLPDTLFSDQAKLIDLDLSHNKLNSLSLKLFLSLDRLERLNLGYNSLSQISSLSPLKSLCYFNIEYNNLGIIPNGFLNNSKQILSINMGHNKLTLNSSSDTDYNATSEGYAPEWQPLWSALHHISNLKMLNLSHNDIRITYYDFLINKHEIVDISFNDIQYLYSGVPIVTLHKAKDVIYANIFKELLAPKVLLISNNPLQCDCKNILIIESYNEQIPRNYFNERAKCFRELQPICKKMRDERRLFVVIHYKLISILLFIGLCIILIFSPVINSKCLIDIFNKPECKYDVKHEIVIEYSIKDSDFILSDILPVFESQKQYKLFLNCIDNTDSAITFYKRNNLVTTCIVIFTSNYYNYIKDGAGCNNFYSKTSQYGNIIYVILKEMEHVLESKVSVDTLNINKSIKWQEPKFWVKFSDLLEQDFINKMKQFKLRK